MKALESAPAPSMQQVLTPSQGWRSLRQVRRPVISMARHPGPERLPDSGTRREAQIPARRGMDNQGEGHDYYGTLQLHGLHPRLPDVRTPGR